MRIAYFNDTSAINHLGCQAVANSHKKRLKAHDVAYTHRVSEFIHLSKLRPGQQAAALKRNTALMAELDDVEGIVINGEGTLHHNRGSEYLAIAYLAKAKGKKVFLLNALFQDMHNYVDILKEADDITVREKYSFDYMTSLGIKNHRLVLDSIVDADFSPAGTHDFQNCVVFTDFHHERPDVGTAMQSVFANIGRGYDGYAAVHYTLMRADAKQTWKGSLVDFRTAKAVVTARHHGVYLAGLAGVPFVACPGNSWKVESLIATSKLPIPVCKTADEVYSGLMFAIENPQVFHKFSQFLHSYQGKNFTTFDKLNSIGTVNETNTH